MATLKQLQASYGSIQKNIDKAMKILERYNDILEKNFAKLSQSTGKEATRDNWEDIVISTFGKGTTMYWVFYHPISSCFQVIGIADGRIQLYQRKLDETKQKIDAMIDEQNSIIADRKPIFSALTTHTENAKSEWLAFCDKRAKRRYDYMQDNKEKFKAILEHAKKHSMKRQM